MWVQVRSMDGKTSSRIDGLSKLTKIEEFREMLVDKFQAPVPRQRLFYRGKQLEDGHTLFDYNVGLNDIIQILVRSPDVVSPKDNSRKQDQLKKATKVNGIDEASEKTNGVKEEFEIKENGTDTNNKENIKESEMSEFYRIGDIVDAKDMVYAAWFEARIENITLDPSRTDPRRTVGDFSEKRDNLLYHIVYENYEEMEGSIALPLPFIRPRASKLLEFDDLKVGDRVMVNYNIDKPGERGYWYDADIEVINHRSKIIRVRVVDADGGTHKNCQLRFVNEVFKIEDHIPVIERDDETHEVALRQNEYKCSRCKDNPSRLCKECSCHVCGGKDKPDKQIMCDECNMAFHLWCLEPPLENIPEEDDWYCPDCKNDETEVVRAGEKLKASKKKSKMASANSSASRDWGKGMACVGRTKECTLVPPNHFGPIPGVEVGTMWKFRVQVSESGVHRPHVAGIHGRESDGAFSIVLSGGYEDDVDEGEEFTYTGSGGRDLSGNKRCADQSCDQTLTRMNKALAYNCAANLNQKGATAKNWKEGKPVRVVRNCKGRKHSEYCPEEGNRYDGIYKVVKYWPEKGKSGFLVWRYSLRRDDPIPAPWTDTGKKRTKKLNLTMQYPDGYLESQQAKEADSKEDQKKKKKKRSEEADDDDDAKQSSKKKKKEIYELDSDVKDLIKADADNKKIWKECLLVVPEGHQAFLKKVEEIFSCICCQEVVYKPITTECGHNICRTCLSRSFKAEVFNCPMCRSELDKKSDQNQNKSLQKVLLAIFPGYNAGR